MLKKSFTTSPARKEISALVAAADKGDAATAAKLLDKYGSSIINEKNEHGWIALPWAAHSGHADMVKMLLERGANIDATDGYRMTALIWASSNFHVDVVRLLLEQGASTKGKDRTEGMTALMWAIVNDGNKEIAELLLENGANIHEQDYEGKTALEISRECDQEEITALLEEWPETLKQRAKEQVEKKKAEELAEEIATFSPALKRDLPRPRPLKLSPRRL